MILIESLILGLRKTIRPTSEGDFFFFFFAFFFFLFSFFFFLFSFLSCASEGA